MNKQNRNIFRNIIAALSLMLVAPAILNGAELRPRTLTYTIGNGLISNNITDIIQDNYGFIWIGTNNGISRFDGTNFRHYTKNGGYGLTNNNVLHLMLDINGKIWASLDNGVDVYDPISDSFKHFTAKTADDVEISRRSIDIMEDSDGDIWISTVNDGLFRYLPLKDSLIVYRHNPNDKNSIAQDYVSTISQSKDGTIWIGTYNEGLCTFSKETEKFKTYKHGTSNYTLSDNSVNAIVEDSYGNIWIGTVNHGIDRFDRVTERFHNISIDDKSKIHHIHLLSETSRGELLVCSDNGASVFKIDENGTLSTKKPSANDSFVGTETNFVYSYLKDHNNNIWIGSLYDGIEFYPSQNDFSYYYNSKTKFGKEISFICEYKDGQYWVGTLHNGIWIFDSPNGSFVPYCTAADMGVSSFNIYSMLVDGDKLWVAAYQQGINAFDIKTKKITRYAMENEESPRAFALLKSSHGRIYAGTSTGLYYYDRIKDLFVLLTECARVTDIAEDMDGVIWVATADAGVIAYDAKTNKVEQYQYDPNNCQSICCNSITAIMVDDMDRIWIGTMGDGLCSYDKKTNLFTKHDYLAVPNNNISQIIQVGNKIWVSTNCGLFEFTLQNKEYKVYGQSSGLVNQIFLPNAGTLTSTGALLLGSSDGICSFTPHNMNEHNKTIMPLLITELSINGQIVTPSTPHSPLSNAIEQTDKIVINHKQSLIGLQFISPTYSDDITYRYKLEKQNSRESANWITVHDKSSIYVRLTPGKYVFRINGGIGGEYNNATEAILAIEMKPHFLLSTTALIIYGILVVITIVIVIRKLLRRMNANYGKHVSLLEKKKEEELYEMKLNFFTEIAHEIRTPMSLIIGPLEELIKSPDVMKSHGDYLMIIERNYKQLLHLINQLIDFRRLDKDGSYTIRCSEFDLSRLISITADTFKLAAADKGIVININCPNPLPVVSDDDALLKVMNNLLNNAIKYTRDIIEINVYEHTSGITIEVADNGIGIPENERERVFDMFYQIRDGSKACKQGIGIGLHLTKQLVEKLGGNIEVKGHNDNTSGAVFSLSLPSNANGSNPDKAVTIGNIDGEATDQNNITGSSNIKLAQTVPSAAHTILIVDDNEDILTFLDKILSPTYGVVKANSGEQALVLLQDRLFDLIISDIIMTGIDGLELCQRIKSDVRARHIPFVLLTAKTDLETKIEGLENNADAYIEKPFSPDFLKAQIGNLIRRREEMLNTYPQLSMSNIRMLTHDKLDKDFIDRCHAIIVSNMSNPGLSVDYLAEQMALSRTAIFKRIKNTTDMTPNDFTKLIRLNEACQMIVEGRYRITEIGFLTGFSSSSYFAKCFAKQFGMLPTEFVKNIESKIEKY